MGKKMLLDVLIEAGTPASFSGRNDLLVMGRKYGGTAWQYEDGWILFHGTLLICTDIGRMMRVLTPPRIKFKSKGFDSVRSRVVNLKELQPSLDPEGLVRLFEGKAGRSAVHLKGDKRTAEEAARLALPEWIFGECPQYEVSHDVRTEAGTLRALLTVRDGYIENARISHDFMEVDFHFPEEKLEGVIYEPKEICDRIQLLAYKELEGKI